MQDDENDVLAELDQLIGLDLEPSIGVELPSVPDTQPETIEDKLPDVPTKVHCSESQPRRTFYVVYFRSRSRMKRSQWQLLPVDLNLFIM